MGLRAWIGVLAVITFSQAAHGQARQFFFPGATAFSPEVSIATTGVVHDVQATVSADRKYVTLNMRSASSTLVDLRAFTFQNGAALGFVGDPPARAGANIGALPGRTGAEDISSVIRTSPSEILAYAKSQASILHRSGMTRVSRLRD